MIVSGVATSAFHYYYYYYFYVFFVLFDDHIPFCCTVIRYTHLLSHGTEKDGFFPNRLFSHVPSNHKLPRHQNSLFYAVSFIATSEPFVFSLVGDPTLMSAKREIIILDKGIQKARDCIPALSF